MVRGRGVRRQQETLSNTEKDTLKQERRDLEGQLNELKEFGQGTPAAQIDQSAIKKQIDRIDRAIEERAIPKVSGSRKDDMAKEAREIEARISEGMPTRDEMDHPARNPGAVRKHMSWLNRNTPAIERYRTIQRTINPDNPESVERLRKDK
jgi:hypothetical protein